jgi:hypothetical protein
MASPGECNLTNRVQPVIVCTGYVRLPVLYASANSTLLASAGTLVDGVPYIARTASDSPKQRLFVQAMVAKLNVDMSGNNIATDSYDSSTNLYSTDGRYDPVKARSRRCFHDFGLANSIGVGNADIRDASRPVQAVQ